MRSTATSFFNILEYLMRLTRETKRENWIHGIPIPIHWYELAIETIKKAINFYESMRLMRYEISRFCLGKKDCVTVREKGSKVKVQKRLILCNIKEIYIEVKSKFPNVKIGFSTFWQLKPKWCVTVDHSGSHSCFSLQLSPEYQTDADSDRYFSLLYRFRQDVCLWYQQQRLYDSEMSFLPWFFRT